jgi:fumarate hydratase class II
MMPVIAYNLLQSITLLTNAAHGLADKAIANFSVNNAHIAEQLSKNPILITALNPIIGYAKGAEIVKQAYKEKRPLKEIAKSMTTLSEEDLNRLLDPYLLTKGGIQQDSH